jgi:hypothetical protein
LRIGTRKECLTASAIGDTKLDLPKVNVHAFKYNKGKQTLEMIGQGSYIILCVVTADTKLSGGE